MKKKSEAGAAKKYAGSPALVGLNSQTIKKFLKKKKLKFFYIIYFKLFFPHDSRFGIWLHNVTDTIYL